jgi:hypothetical protein
MKERPIRRSMLSISPILCPVAGAALAALLSLAACDAPSEDGKTSKAMEERMREIEKRVKDSMPKTQAIALAQKPSTSTIRRAGRSTW